MADVILKGSREKSLTRHHPWVFSGAVDTVRGKPGRGETVDILSPDGRWLARGAYSPESQIRVRVWTFDPEEEVSAGFFGLRLSRSIESRRAIGIEQAADAFRLVNSESAGLPGLIVDRYDRFLVCQFLTAGAERWKDAVVSWLERLTACTGIYERSDADVRAKEGLPPSVGRLSGEEPPEVIEIHEHGCRYLVDVRHGHKTGFYLDQRDNRACLARYASGRDVLNCFSYTGGFSIAALKGGASHAVNVDSSGSALGLAARNVLINGFDPGSVENIEADVFTLLRRFRDSRRSFDLIVLDPPKFAESKGQIMRASRGYKDINLLALKILKPGGILFTFSCSGLIERDLFQKIVSDAALDAGREASIIHWLTQSSDHPVSLNFPEASYLKGLVCLVK
ncbi:MAG TPA: class I SAM-dependent methyltransferase [Deltaproteobacteria bacterium]|nr:class I SAM-dependent methyltransferase [Deltaproteobacteria bacterium]